MVPQQEVPRQEVVVILLTDFLALALVSVVIVVLPQVVRLPQEAPRVLRVVLRVLPLVVAVLWVVMAALYLAQE